MKIALLGIGTVGKGVYDMLCACEGLEVGRVLVREGKADAPYKCTDIRTITEDPEIGGVAEVMGGIEPAYSYLAAALRAGKHAVTANKALVAEKGPELAQLARENGVSFLFSAACGGGVPFLHNLALAARSDRILSVSGILNGTTNFMLDRMQRMDMDYASALHEAQQLGYAEADPTADVSGLDTLRKLMLACAVAFDMLPTEGLDREGIESFSAADAAHIRSLGLTCRLIARGERKDECLSAFVEPVLFPASAPECSVLENYNMAGYVGSRAGSIVLMGQGAGRYPTASAVMRDLYSVSSGAEMLRAGCRRTAADNSVCLERYYVRLPKPFADCFKAERRWEEDAVLRMITEPISVREMHARAKEIREKGGEIFFAALGE